MFRQQPSRLWFPTIVVLALTLIVAAINCAFTFAELHREQHTQSLTK